MNRIAKFLMLCLFFYHSFQSVIANTAAIYENLHYGTDEVAWVDAVKRCQANRASLVSFNPKRGSNSKNVTIVKRSVHLKDGNESWVGDYKTYDVMKGQDVKLDIRRYQCVAIHITTVMVLPNNNRMYGYDLVTENCTSELPSICTYDNGTMIRIYQTFSKWFEDRDCDLWEPDYKTKSVAEQTRFASGNFTSSKDNPRLLNSFYWVNYVVQEQPSKLPRTGDILRCGYINHNSTGVDYTDCFQKKSFICQTETNENLSSPSSSSSSPSTSVSKEFYIGLTVSLVFIVAVIVGVALFLFRIRQIQGTKPSEKLPSGGKSFIRRREAGNLNGNVRDNAAFKDNNRITTYHQINLDQLKMMSFDNDANFETDNRISDHTYSVVQKKKKNDNKPDVVPRINTRKGEEHPGYLSMDGISTKQSTDGADKEYDFLESKRSNSSSRCGRISNNATEGNLYSSTQTGINDSNYDVTFHRGPSQKRLIDQEYDHIEIESGSTTMNRGTCESIGEQYSSPNIAATSPVINPSYDKVVIQLKNPQVDEENI